MCPLSKECDKFIHSCPFWTPVVRTHGFQCAANRWLRSRQLSRKPGGSRRGHRQAGILASRHPGLAVDGLCPRSRCETRCAARRGIRPMLTDRTGACCESPGRSFTRSYAGRSRTPGCTHDARAVIHGSLRRQYGPHPYPREGVGAPAGDARKPGGMFGVEIARHAWLEAGSRLHLWDCVAVGQELDSPSVRPPCGRTRSPRHGRQRVAPAAIRLPRNSLRHCGTPLTPGHAIGVPRPSGRYRATVLAHSDGRWARTANTARSAVSGATTYPNPSGGKSTMAGWPLSRRRREAQDSAPAGGSRERQRARLRAASSTAIWPGWRTEPFLIVAQPVGCRPRGARSAGALRLPASAARSGRSTTSSAASLRATLQARPVATDAQRALIVPSRRRRRRACRDIVSTSSIGPASQASPTPCSARSASSSPVCSTRPTSAAPGRRAMYRLPIGGRARSRIGFWDRGTPAAPPRSERAPSAPSSVRLPRTARPCSPTASRT